MERRLEVDRSVSRHVNSHDCVFVPEGERFPPDTRGLNTDRKSSGASGKTSQLTTEKSVYIYKADQKSQERVLFKFHV